jgi:ferrous iron transport protein A
MAIPPLDAGLGGFTSIYCERVAIGLSIWQRRRMTLDLVPIGKSARIVAIDWSLLAGEEGQRLRALGIDQGAELAIAHRGVFGGGDPLAVTIGRMTVALRRSHARAMTVDMLA